MQYNQDRLVIVKRRPEKYSLQLATESRQRRCIPDRRRRLFHAEATGKARSPSVEETEERSIEKTTKSYVNTFRKVYIRKK